MNMKPLSLLLCSLLVTACSRNLSVSTTPVSAPVSQAADPAGVQMLPVSFRVINRDNLEAFLAELRQSQSTDNPVFVAITTQDYENLALNLADITRYISQQRSIVIYYREITNSATPRNSR